MLVAEADQLMHGRKHWTYLPRPSEPADVVIEEWSPRAPEEKWLARHYELKGGSM
jgi:hypothetical protein